jgi:hypothetical protein
MKTVSYQSGSDPDFWGRALVRLGMDTCTIEIGLLRKKPCGHNAVARCLNCDQPLCTEHSIAQLSEAGHKTGKYMCKECDTAAKEHAKTMAGVARTQEARKLAALDKQAREVAAAPPAPPKKPPASVPTQPPAAAEEKSKEPETLEFTPSKKEEPGNKPG